MVRNCKIYTKNQETLAAKNQKLKLSMKDLILVVRKTETKTESGSHSVGLITNG